MANLHRGFFLVPPNHPCPRTATLSPPSRPDLSGKKRRERDWFPPPFSPRCVRRTAGFFQCFHFPPPPPNRCPAGEIPFAGEDNSGGSYDWDRPGCPGSCPPLKIRRCKGRIRQTEPPADK